MGGAGSHPSPDTTLGQVQRFLIDAGVGNEYVTLAKWPLKNIGGSGWHWKCVSEWPQVSLADGFRDRWQSWSQRCFWPDFWLHVQTAHHWQQQCWQNLLPLPLCRWHLHLSLCQHGGHWLQGEDSLPPWEASEAADLGESWESWAGMSWEVTSALVQSLGGGASVKLLGLMALGTNAVAGLAPGLPPC